MISFQGVLDSGLQQYSKENPTLGSLSVVMLNCSSYWPEDPAVEPAAPASAMPDWWVACVTIGSLRPDCAPKATLRAPAMQTGEVGMVHHFNVRVKNEPWAMATLLKSWPIVTLTSAPSAPWCWATMATLSSRLTTMHQRAKRSLRCEVHGTGLPRGRLISAYVEDRSGSLARTMRKLAGAVSPSGAPNDG